MQNINPLNKDYFVTGDDVRDDDPRDKIFEATRELKLGRMLVSRGGLVRYNGKSAVTRPCGYAPICDEETNHPSVELAIRRGWLKPWVRPEDRLSNRLVTNGKKAYWRVAQVVERMFHTHHVGGSTPSSPTNKDNDNA